MTPIYRTTKIPAFYFKEIEGYLSKSDEFVSVSEFIRDSIKEKLSRIRSIEFEQRYFIIMKDVVFNDENILKVHDRIMSFSENKADNKLLKTIPLQKIINKSSDANYLKFLAKFLFNFAYYHPFEDGNKRTSWALADIFLRLNNKKLKLEAKESKETQDEIFIWQNSANQKMVEDLIEFLNKHIADYTDNSNDLDEEIKKSIEENELMLKKLSR